MRAMPFRVASDSSVVFTEPRLSMGDTVIVAGDPAPTWDYLTTSIVIGGFTVDESELLRSTALTDLAGLGAVLQVDCQATGFRCTTTVPVSSAIDHEALMQVELAPHKVAGEIEVRYGLVLEQQNLETLSSMAAHKRGSRVYSPPRIYRFLLEGVASGFPTEAFDFGPTGYPTGAAWHLSFRADSADEPFMGAARLFINTKHPAAGTLLSGNPGLIRSVLFHGVLEQLLLTAADLWRDELSAEHEEGSVGAVLQELTETYLGMALPATVAAIHGDRDRLLTKLREATGLLDGSV